VHSVQVNRMGMGASNPPTGGYCRLTCNQPATLPPPTQAKRRVTGTSADHGGFETLY
jgi:hypothetical protein